MRANKKSRKIKKVSSFLARFRFQADVLDAMNALISPYGGYLFLGGGGGEAHWRRLSDEIFFVKDKFEKTEFTWRRFLSAESNLTF